MNNSNLTKAFNTGMMRVGITTARSSFPEEVGVVGRFLRNKKGYALVLGGEEDA